MKKSNKKKGASLIIVLMVLAIAMILSSVTLTTISRTTKANASEKKSEDVLYAAESGLQYGIAYFGDDSNEAVINSITINEKRNIEGIQEINNSSINVYIELISQTTESGKIIKKYKIESEARRDSKSRKVSIVVTAKSGTGGSGENPFGDIKPALIVPSIDKIFTSGVGNNRSYDINNAFMYEKEKYYDYLRGDKNGFDEISPSKYLKNPGISIPIINFTQPQINIDFTKNYQFTGNGSGQRIVGNTIYSGSTYEIGKEGIHTVYYYNGDLNIYPVDNNNNPVDQDLSNIKIYVKGKTSIYAQKDINLKNMNIITTNLDIKSQNYSVAISNSNISAMSTNIEAQNGDVNLIESKIESNYVKVRDQNKGIDINKSEINASTVEIIAQNANMDIVESKINAMVINISNQNRTINIKDKSEITAQKFIVETQNAPISIEYSNVKAEEIKLDSKNASINTKNGTLLSNTINMITEGGGDFNSSSIISKEIEINLKNNKQNIFTNSMVVTDKLAFKGNINGDKTVRFIVTNDTEYNKSLEKVIEYLKLDDSPEESNVNEYNLGESKYD